MSTNVHDILRSLRSPQRPATSAAVGLLLLIIPGVMSAVSAGGPPGAEPEPASHTLFMGADIDLKWNNAFHRVRDVSGGSFVIKIGGEDVLIPMDRGPVGFKIEQSLKLTEASATIVGLKGERAYTSANDPVKAFVRQQPGTAGLDMVGRADGAALIASIEDSAVMNVTIPNNPIAQAYYQKAIDDARANLSANQENASAAGAQLNAEYNQIGAYTAKMQAELAKQLFDAVEVTFEVSSPQPLNKPYVVIVAQFRERDEKPGTAHNWIYARTLDPIDSKPRKVRLLQGGLPPGFELIKFKLHLYDRGQELATNVAENRVPLTREDAFNYLKIDYITSHKDTTFAATAAMGRLPADLRSRLTSAQLAQTYFVKVSKDGLPGEAFADESCAQKVEDPYVLSVIRDLRFRPALDKGRAVDGIARLNFENLSF